MESIELIEVVIARASLMGEKASASYRRPHMLCRFRMKSCWTCIRMWMTRTRLWVLLCLLMFAHRICAHVL